MGPYLCTIPRSIKGIESILGRDDTNKKDMAQQISCWRAYIVRSNSSWPGIETMVGLSRIESGDHNEPIPPTIDVRTTRLPLRSQDLY